MQIEQIDPRRVCVALSAKDLAALGVTYEKLLFEEEALGGLVAGLLKKIRQQTGFECGMEKLFIEAYPEEGGGCVLYFTALEKKDAPTRYRPKDGQLSPHLFRFAGTQDMIDACKAVFAHMSHRIYRSSLYYSAGRYILSVCPLDAPRSHAVRLLGEYGGYLGKGALLEGVVQEHARPVRLGDAIDAVSQHL